MKPKAFPTRIGDVLIVQTTQSYTVFAVGHVKRNGQQDFTNSDQVRHELSLPAALERAKTLQEVGRHIYLHDLDSSEWRRL